MTPPREMPRCAWCGSACQPGRRFCRPSCAAQYAAEHMRPLSRPLLEDVGDEQP